MATCIAICNQKGGVGKSTTAVNVAAYLALAGKRTLLVDLDAQGNATTACGVQRGTVDLGTYAVLVNGAPIARAVLRTAIDRLSIVPSNIDLAGAEPFLTTVDRREFVLKRACETVSPEYDFILFDCPPALGILTVNALVAADSTIVPVQCEYFALEGLNSLIKAINLIRENLNPGLRVGGIVLTMTDFRANLTREVAQEVRGFFKDLVFNTAIPRNVRLAESPSFGKPICLYDPASAGALAYHLLTQEVIAKEGERQP